MIGQHFCVFKGYDTTCSAHALCELHIFCYLSSVKAKKELAEKRWQLMQAQQQIEELDWLFKRIYEDYANGKVSHRRF